MDLIGQEQRVADTIGAATAVAPVGTGTHREVGGPPPSGTEVRAPTGIVTYDPAELTVTVGAGTSVAELERVLGDAGQECPLDPRDAAATVGGTLAVGLSGHRRLRYGPMRDRVLEVRFATADGRLARGGGPTVKNVTGYDMPRLLVGSYGTLGVLTRVILRCQPLPEHTSWYATDDAPEAVRQRCFRPSTMFWSGRTTSVLLEGAPPDVAAEAGAAGLVPLGAAPTLPDGPHRGRISISPGSIRTLAENLDRLGDHVAWLAEWGIGTVHVATETERSLAATREIAASHGGWMLREAGAPGLDGFGRALPNAALMARVKAAFDPTGKLAPGRLPIAPAPVEHASHTS